MHKHLSVLTLVSQDVFIAQLYMLLYIYILCERASSVKRIFGAPCWRTSNKVGGPNILSHVCTLPPPRKTKPKSHHVFPCPFPFCLLSVHVSQFLTSLIMCILRSFLYLVTIMPVANRMTFFKNLK